MLEAFCGLLGQGADHQKDLSWSPKQLERWSPNHLCWTYHFKPLEDVSGVNRGSVKAANIPTQLRPPVSAACTKPARHRLDTTIPLLLCGVQLNWNPLVTKAQQTGKKLLSALLSTKYLRSFTCYTTNCETTRRGETSTLALTFADPK